MKVTIKDVAKAAGVSPSTVSRALHDNPRISEEMRKQIKKIAQEMDFHPNQMARSLVSRRSRIIGVVFPGEIGESLNHSFYPSVLQGLGHVAGSRRYHMLLGTGAEGDTIAEAARQLTDSGYAEGLILLAAEDVPAADTAGLPVVTLGHPANDENGYYVDNDNIAAGKAATQYLLDRGHRRIALLGYDKQFMVTADRRKGYQQALEEAGLPFRKEDVVPSRYLHNTTDESLLRSLFEKPDRPTAVVCMDDAQAITLCHMLNDMGLSVPGDVSLISYNDTPAGRLNNPPLTSINVDPYQLGQKAMELVITLVKHPETPPTGLIIPFSIVERESVRTL